VFIGRATTGVTRTLLLRVTLAGALATNGAGTGKLALASAAFFVGRVANSIIDVLASFRVAALVVSTSLFTAAVAIFARLDDAVATLATGHRLDIAVVFQTGCPVAVFEERANISDTTGGETRNFAAGGGSHHKFASGIARARILGERAALRRASAHRTVTRVIAIVNSTECVACLVSKDLPFCVKPDNDIGARNGSAATGVAVSGLVAWVLMRALTA
jgi:hypothetical protein